MVAKKNKKGRTAPAYTPEERLKVVKLFLEEGYTAAQVAAEFKIAKSSLSAWVKRYREGGPSGLLSKPHHGKSSSDRRPSPAKAQILAHKKANPDHGAKRISQIFRRILGLKVSTHEIRETLREESLLKPPPKVKPRNDPKPRFFERATPNQMWQTDIMTFRLAGQNAYLIGFMDDYSRYITGLGAYRAQNAENVLETFKIAFGEYGIPKELLSDNGRQYHNWRGTTKFEKLLGTHRIKHIRSAPHHPQTLGKIERFWQTIQQEFLFKCQFESFENFRERLNAWVKFYNFKRPNQGIAGMCPADRYFEIRHELKKTLSKTIEENVQELALRGGPKNPFYMVGRLGNQNVAILAEKGKLTMHVDDPGRPEGRSIECVLDGEITENTPKININAGEIENVQANGKNNEAGFKNDIVQVESNGNSHSSDSGAGVEAVAAAEEPRIVAGIEMQGGSRAVDENSKRECTLSGIGDSASSAGTLGESGVGGHVAAIGTASPDAGNSGDRAAETLGIAAETSSDQASGTRNAVEAPAEKTANNLKCAVIDINFSITV